ncbi:unnamed protein product [Knipowitschia caucasica]
MAAAKRFSEYMKMRRLTRGKWQWTEKQWEGGVVPHSAQQDGSSCGVLTLLMAEEILRCFPSVPANIIMDHSSHNMVQEGAEAGSADFC